MSSSHAGSSFAYPFISIFLFAINNPSLFLHNIPNISYYDYTFHTFWHQKFPHHIFLLVFNGRWGKTNKKMTEQLDHWNKSCFPDQWSELQRRPLFIQRLIPWLPVVSGSEHTGRGDLRVQLEKPMRGDSGKPEHREQQRLALRGRKNTPCTACHKRQEYAGMSPNQRAKEACKWVKFPIYPKAAPTGERVSPRRKVINC